MYLLDLIADPSLPSLLKLALPQHAPLLNSVLHRIYNHYHMDSPPYESTKLLGFNQPRVWTIMNSLAAETKSINLGQGFPSWDPPKFFTDNLHESVLTSSHQYARAYGSLGYLQSIKNFHRSTFDNLDIEKNIVTSFGGSEALYCAILGLVNQGEEVIIFDPAYDCYRPQVQMAGGKTIGIQLRPRKCHTKAEIIQRFEKSPIEATAQDEWDFEIGELQAAINQKTKILIITTPHNPVGKVFTHEQLDKIAEIMRKNPHVIIIQDNVYEGMTYDDMLGDPTPKIIQKHKDLHDRVLSVYSGGKIFAATGVRCGWLIGPEHLIRSARSVHQYAVFCQYNPLENGVGKSLDHISAPNNTYLLDFAKDMIAKRNLLVKQLLASSFDFDIWVPKGSHFILADISHIQVKQKYTVDENGHKRTKDYAFAFQLAKENGVICIPCSPFYDKNNVSEGEKYVRFAFCKSDEEILQAGRRLALKFEGP